MAGRIGEGGVGYSERALRQHDEEVFLLYLFRFLELHLGDDTIFLGFGVGLHLYGLGDHEDIAHGHRPGIAVQFEITLLEDVDITGAKGVLVNICSAEKNRLTLECRC